MTIDLVVTVPAWVHDVVTTAGPKFGDDAAKMTLAIALSAENIARGGGPFAAVVFDADRCVAAGVNRVIDTGYSIAHAEIVALMSAQRVLNTVIDKPSLTLVTSAEPCCQCFGAIVWSGVDRLVCGATTADVEAIGFDEGPKPADWQARLRERGIAVTEQVQRDEARVWLREYKERGGLIYGLRPMRAP
jgi:tRNA(Arg) A34 adenosine deaminase TadA